MIALPWYGGKSRMAKRLIRSFVPHTTFVETHAGGLGVLLKKLKAAIEYANDLDYGLINFYVVLVGCTDELCDFLSRQPYSADTFRQALVWRSLDDPIKQAAGFLIRNRMSFSSTGRTFMIDRMGIDGANWLPFIRQLPKIAARLRGVRFRCQDAISLIEEVDAESTLLYVDPPYIEDTRSTDRHYAHEMTLDQHECLLKTLIKCRSMVYLSGYRSELYDDYLKDWHRVEWTVKSIASHSAGDGRQRTECLWAPGRAGLFMSMQYQP